MNSPILSSLESGLDDSEDSGNAFVIIDLPAIHEERRRIFHPEYVASLLTGFVYRVGKFLAAEAGDKISFRHACGPHDLEELGLDVCSLPQRLPLEDHVEG